MIELLDQLRQRLCPNSTKPHTQIMPAGRALDRRIAIDILGWTPKMWHDPYDDTTYGYLLRTPDQSPQEALADRLPTYSTDRSSADAVADHLRSLGWVIAIAPVDDAQSAWQVILTREKPHQLVRARAATVAHAVCLAALRTTL